MATARWFYEREPDSRFVIQEHLRQDYWRNGPAALWIDVAKSDPPYRAVGYWHELQFELDWAPVDYVRLSASERSPELIRVTSLQLGFRPTREGVEGDRHVTLWQLTESADPVLEPTSATPVIDTEAEEIA